MVPTRQWMSQIFKMYNAKYFGGQLPTPMFVVRPLVDEWGRYTPHANYNKRTRQITTIQDSGILSLTSQFSRSEKSIIGTMLHEMIHEYIYLVMKINPQNQHGREFQSIANRLNADGWNISEANEILDTDIEGGKDEGMESQYLTPCYICIFEKPNGSDYKIWVCKCDINKKQQYISAIRKIKSVTNINFYKCFSQGLLNDKESPTTLYGFGGMSLNEVFRNMNSFYGENTFSLNNLQKI